MWPMAPSIELRSWTSLSNALLQTLTMRYFTNKERVYSCPCRSSEIDRRGSKRYAGRDRHPAGRDLPTRYPGRTSLRAGAAALRGAGLRVGFRGGDDHILDLQHGGPVHPELGGR